MFVHLGCKFGVKQPDQTFSHGSRCHENLCHNMTSVMSIRTTVAFRVKRKADQRGKILLVAGHGERQEDAMEIFIIDIFNHPQNSTQRPFKDLFNIQYILVRV